MATAFGTALISYRIDIEMPREPSIGRLDTIMMVISAVLWIPIRKMTLNAWHRYSRWSFSYALAATISLALIAYIGAAWILLDGPHIKPGSLPGIGHQCAGKTGFLIPPEVLPTDPDAPLIYQCVSRQAFNAWLATHDPEGARGISFDKFTKGLIDLWVIVKAPIYALTATTIFWLYVFGPRWRVQTTEP